MIFYISNVQKNFDTEDNLNNLSIDLFDEIIANLCYIRRLTFLINIKTAHIIGGQFS